LLKVICRPILVPWFRGYHIPIFHASIIIQNECICKWCLTRKPLGPAEERSYSLSCR
jgi:hypothetical protein